MATDPTPTQQSWAMDCGWLTDWSFTEASLHPEQRTLLTRGRAQLLWFTTGYLFHHAPQAIPWIWEEIDLLNMPARLMKYCHAGGCLSSTHWFLWIYFISFIFCWFSGSYLTLDASEDERFHDEFGVGDPLPLKAALLFRRALENSSPCQFYSFLT